MRRRLTLAVPLTVIALAACHEGDSPADALLARSGGLTAPSIEGKFEMRIASMDDGTSRKSYHVRTPDGTRDLVTDQDFDLKYDTVVRAWGEPDDDYAFDLDELEVIAPPPSPLIDPDPYAYRRIATVIVFWNQAGLTNGSAKGSMFLDDDSTNVFYGENSYGKETIAGDVFGPYEIPQPGSCNPTYIADQGLQAFVDHEHDPDEYRQFMWHFPSMGDCGFGGLASVGGVENPARDSWYNGNFGCVVRAQEIGHNYGMGHSHSYDCPNGTIVPEGDECEHVEYGDPHDPMGGGCDHMNVAQKAYMGWLEGCNIVTTQNDGLFNVVPTELPCNGTQALRFPSSDDRWYYVEYRQNYGVDAGFDAVLLHLSSSHDYSPSPYIIESGTDPDGDTTYFMEAGDTFTDPAGTVSFTVVEELGTHAVIQVTFPDGGAGGEPQCDGGGMPEMAGGAVGSLECDAEPFPLDTSPPTVEITYPADGAVFQTGSDFTITAEAMDDRWITEAELYVQIIGEDDEPQPLFKLFDPPYEYAVTSIPAGEYLFGFVVRDGPNQGVSEPVVVEVRDDVPTETTGGDESADESTTDDPTDTNDDEDDLGDTVGEEPDTSSSDDGGAPLDDDGSCNCSTDGRGDRGAVAALGLLVLGLGARRRRR